MGKINTVTFLPPRDEQAYKNNFGRVLMIGGSMGMSGAAILMGKAALRSGAGLVELLCPDCIWQIAAAAQPCYMCRALPDDHNGRISENAIEYIRERISGADVVAIGPGLGCSEQLREIVCSLITYDQLPLIIDADGLNNLAAINDWADMLVANLIVTPHPGEMRRLCKSLSDFETVSDREDLAIEFSNASGAVTVLKGAATVVSCGEDYYVNETGNPGMATGGSGDVLTEILAAVMAQLMLAKPEVSGQEIAFEAAVMATYIHGLAGDIACDKFGEVSMTATDIINCLPDAFKACSENA